MNSQVRKYYRKLTEEDIPLHLFYDVIPLHEVKNSSWQEMVKNAGDLPQGWFELSQLSIKDRIDFTCQYWLKTLPYIPHVHQFLENFFSRLDNVGVFLTKQHFDSAYACEMVYSLRDGSCFFHGLPPCKEEAIHALNQKFQNTLPEDYLSFLQIHNGFSKFLDKGLILAENLNSLSYEKIVADSSGNEINPKNLIPFYESFEEKKYQCFFMEWVPINFVGNVFYSSQENLISEIKDPKKWAENLAFPTFLDWLILYLEGIEG